MNVIIVEHYLIITIIMQVKTYLESVLSTEWSASLTAVQKFIDFVGPLSVSVFASVVGSVSSS